MLYAQVNKTNQPAGILSCSLFHLLDEIIKLNRKKVKTEKKDLLQPKDNFQRAGWS